MLADVVLPSRRFQVFTYQIPQQLQRQVHVGSPVLIPLSSSVVSGVVVRILEQTDRPSVRSSKTTLVFRDILSVEAAPDYSSIDQKLLSLVEKIADYYLAPLAACLPLIVPPRGFTASKRLVLTESGRLALSNMRVSAEDQMVLQKISRSSKGMLRASLLRISPKVGTVLAKLKKKGWIKEQSTLPASSKGQPREIRSARQRAQPASSFPAMGDLFEQDVVLPPKLSSKAPTLSGNMKKIGNELVNKVQAEKFATHMVRGTNDERLQVFLHIASIVLKQGRRVLFLVPEVHQVDLMARQLEELLDASVDVYHGQLSAPVRARCWQQIHQGTVQLVVGTRSAVFVPLPDLGLIWVDQEEDTSYKDEQLPYYHVREVAKMRGTIEEALVVYGSLCPSLESYSEFQGKIPLPNQVACSKNPAMNLIDMRDYESGTILSPPLIDQLTQVLKNGQQAILILNRKGFSQSLICRDCGQAPGCEMCRVSLRLFQRPSRLLCSYCGKNFPMPETCSSCLGTVFRFFGMGTQRLEEELTRLFPSHALFRFDREQVKTLEEGQNVLQRFRQGDIQLLIGTEFLLHQADPPTAQLVAFPQADLGMHLPDFRSAERTFLLFSKAVQLVQTTAQSNDSSGTVFFQTRMPDHHVFQAMIQHDPHVFYQQERDLRGALAYPPASHLLLLVVTGAQAIRVQRVVDFLAQQVKEAGMDKALPQGGPGMLELPMVLGPLDSRKPGRLKKNRTIFLIKTFHLEETQQHLRKIQQAYDKQFGKDPVVFEVHVDPLDIQ